MSCLLNAAYLATLLGATPWIAYRMLRTGRYRAGWGEKLLGRVPIRAGNGSCIWMHAVSVGEVNLLAPLIERLESRGQLRCVMSSTTDTGLALARRKYPRLSTFYAPLDFSWSVGRAMQRIRPDLLVLAELELWPNLIRAARKRGTRIAVVNGRLSERSFRGYRRIGPLARSMLRSIDLIAAQNDHYAERFLRLGARPESVRVTGSLKFDGAQTNRDNPHTNRLAGLAGIVPDDAVFLAGSTQQPEEALAMAVYDRLRREHSKLRLILVPRHPERFDEVAALLDRSGHSWQRRSRLDAEGANPRARILLVDTVGELGAWWGTANLAFVGGSLGSRGGQNMIEPAAYGAAVSFGPNTRNFRDVVTQMLDRGAAVVVRDSSEMTDFVRRCLEVPRYAASLGERAARLVRDNLGATDRTLELLDQLLPKSDSSDNRAAA